MTSTCCAIAWAAEALAALGDATGLSLWESREGLWPEELADRKRRLKDLAARATGEAGPKAAALLDGSWGDESPKAIWRAFGKPSSLFIAS